MNKLLNLVFKEHQKLKKGKAFSLISSTTATIITLNQKGDFLVFVDLFGRILRK